MGLKKYINELKRRNVFKAALAYLVVSWVITQIVATIFPMFGAPEYLSKIVVFVLVIGFPLWIIFSWVYEITPDGIKKTLSINPEESIAPETSNRLNKIILGALSLAIILLLVNIFSPITTSINSVESDETLAFTPDDNSIAVLAFADMSPEKDQEYFSDGISEEILNLLAKVQDLKVVSRTSSFSYKGKEQNIKKIGEELHVGHILEGSIRKAGNTFRITAQLINVENGLHVWSETYDKSIEDIFKIQDEIAAKVTDQLKVTLLGDELVSKTVNTSAYNLYLQAKQLLAQNSSESSTNALQLIRESLAIDSLYAPSWVFLSNAIYDASFKYVKIPYSEALVTGKAAAQKAIQLDPEYAMGYVQLATYEKMLWNFEEQSKTLNKAIQLDPHNPNVIKGKASAALHLGNLEEAINLILQVIELDPLNSVHLFNLGLYYWMEEQYEQAEITLNKYLLLYPNSGTANSIMCEIQIGLGNPDKGLVYLEKDTDPFWHLYRKCLAVYAQGNTIEANKLLDELVQKWGHDSWPNIADVYAFRNEIDEAFKWLDLAFDNKDASILELLSYPSFKNLWGDPRWNAFINKLGLPDDHSFHLD